MDPIKDDSNYNTMCIMNSDDLCNKNSYINSRNCESDSIFNILMHAFVSDDHNSFRILFTSDYYFIFYLENKDYESDLVFYALSKFINYVKNDENYLKQFNDCLEFHDIFENKSTFCFYQCRKLYKESEIIFNKYNEYAAISFLLNCLQRLENVKNTYLQIGNIDRNKKIFDELENQYINHICLIDGIFFNDSGISNEKNFTNESVLLPFVVGNDYYFPIISKIAIFLHDKYGLNSLASNNFYLVFGNILMNIHHYIIKYPVESRFYELFFSTLYQLMSIKVSYGSVRYPIAVLMSKLPTWNVEFVTDAMGKEFERLTFLGPFLSASMFADDDSEIAINHFKDESLQEVEIVSEQKTLQSKLEMIWDLQFKIIKLLLVEKNTHNDTIDFINRALYVNKTRGQLQPEESISSGEGFIANINAVLHRLVAPIKIDKVDVNFLTLNVMSSNEYNFGKLLVDETRIYFDNDALMREYHRLQTKTNSANANIEPVNFHTNIFYMCTVCHHYGIIASIRKQSRRINAIQSLERSVNEINRLMNTNQLTAAQIQMHQSTFNRYKSMIRYQKRAILCSQIVLFSDTFLRCTLEFYVQVAQVLSSPAVIGGTNLSTLSSLVAVANPSFSAMPQFMLDDMADFLLFLMSKKPNVFSYVVNSLYDLCSFILFIATHSHLIRSPYLVAKFVEIIFSCLPNVNNHAALQPIYRTFWAHYAVTNGFLTNRLIRFYIDVEKTGASSEFYDKFSIRFKISIIFRSLWKNGTGAGGNDMKIHLLNEVANDLDQFVKFINRAMNDMVYLLDESITSLKRIRTNQEKRNDPHQWAQCTRHEQLAILQQLNIDERTTKSQLTLAEVTVEMLYEFTYEIKDPFLSSELVEKLASMLNSFLLELVGPKCRDLKVSDPDKYNWNPKKLLQNIVRIYLNLDSPVLVEAISNEERYYSSELFTNALSKLDNYNIISKHELEHFDIFRQKIDSLVQQHHIDEASADNVPPEYLDPIMSCIMKEPVMLPQSKIIVDKSVIKRHLLNDDCDPFNRQPLKIEDLIPQPDLQKEIQQWKINSKKN